MRRPRDETAHASAARCRYLTIFIIAGGVNKTQKARAKKNNNDSPKRVPLIDASPHGTSRGRCIACNREELRIPSTPSKRNVANEGRNRLFMYFHYLTSTHGMFLFVSLFLSYFFSPRSRSFEISSAHAIGPRDVSRAEKAGGECVHRGKKAGKENERTERKKKKR